VIRRLYEGRDVMGAKLTAELPSISERGEDAPLDLIEVVGVIKWFDASKGYGFIVPDNGMPDVLLHVTCLRRDGYHTAYEGARVVCEVLDRPKGLQAFRVLSMDESTAIQPAQSAPARTNHTVTPTSGLERAVVKWFNRAGRGFVSRIRTETFCPYGDCVAFGLTELRRAKSLVRYGDGQGLMAAEIRRRRADVALANGREEGSFRLDAVR
jgi:CspA family cold shock protein